MEDLKQKIKDAVATLDPKKDSNWTKEGLANMSVINIKLGQTVTREQLEDAVPGLHRDKFDELMAANKAEPAAATNTATVDAANAPPAEVGTGIPVTQAGAVNAVNPIKADVETRNEQDGVVTNEASSQVPAEGEASATETTTAETADGPKPVATGRTDDIELARKIGLEEIDGLEDKDEQLEALTDLLSRLMGSRDDLNRALALVQHRRDNIVLEKEREERSGQGSATTDYLKARQEQMAQRAETMRTFNDPDIKAALKRIPKPAPIDQALKKKR